MAYGVSNGHVTPKGAVRQYGRLSYRQLGFLYLFPHDVCDAVKIDSRLTSDRNEGSRSW